MAGRPRKAKTTSDACQHAGGCDRRGKQTLTIHGQPNMWLCAKHYRSDARLLVGFCTRCEGEVQRASNLRRGRPLKEVGAGYCRRCEPEYLKLVDDDKLVNLLSYASQVKVDPDSDCWTWETPTGVRAKINVGNWSTTVYRFLYVYFYGGHAQGLELGHVCANAHCVNPIHVRPLTRSANLAEEQRVDFRVEIDIRRANRAHNKAVEQGIDTALAVEEYRSDFLSWQDDLNLAG